MKKNEFKCAACKGVFKKGWSDEEAHEERKNTFGDYPLKEMELVCDDCYKQMVK